MGLMTVAGGLLVTNSKFNVYHLGSGLSCRS